MSRAHALIRALVDVRAEIIEAVRALGQRGRSAVAIGTWSAEDVVRHLIGWDRTNRLAVGNLRLGRLPAFYARYDRDWASYNAALVRRHRRSRGAQLLRAARRSQRRLVATLASLSEREWARDRGVRFRGTKVTIERLMRVELADERRHLRDLQGVAKARRT